MLIGYPVEYVGNFPEFNLLPGVFDVRILLLLWTGDYPAQSEVEKFINGGILACRRDKHKGEKKKYLIVIIITCNSVIIEGCPLIFEDMITKWWAKLFPYVWI